MVSNNCIINTTRYSTRSEGLLFSIEFESNVHCTLLQCCEEAALGEYPKIILQCVVGPVKVDQKAVWGNEALEFHAMVFL